MQEVSNIKFITGTSHSKVAAAVNKALAESERRTVIASQSTTLPTHGKDGKPTGGFKHHITVTVGEKR